MQQHGRQDGTGPVDAEQLRGAGQLLLAAASLIADAAAMLTHGADGPIDEEGGEGSPPSTLIQLRGGLTLVDDPQDGVVLQKRSGSPHSGLGPRQVS